MAILHVEYFSDALHMKRKVNVLYPEVGKVENFTGTDIPVLYLLHGMTDTENEWLSRTALDRMLHHTNVALVMPEGDLSFYTNTTYGMNYYDAIAKELPEKMHFFFPNLSTKPEKNFIAGVSMGGYGAMHVGLGVENFGYVGSLSGLLNIHGLEEHWAADKPYWDGVWGPMEKFPGSDNEIITQAKNRTENKPKIFSWIGKQDNIGLYPGTKEIIPQIEALGYDVTFHEEDGIHSWYSWLPAIQELLLWLPIGYVPESNANDAKYTFAMS